MIELIKVEDTRRILPYTTRDVRRILPHGEKWRLLDHVDIVELKTSALQAIGGLTVTEGHCEDHFPSMPIFPAAFSQEMVAQTLAMLFYHQHPEHWGKIPLFREMKNPKWSNLAFPGDRIIATVEITEIKTIKGGRIKMTGKGEASRVSDKLELIFSVEEIVGVSAA